jgi:hypothetical protein
MNMSMQISKTFERQVERKPGIVYGQRGREIRVHAKCFFRKFSAAKVQHARYDPMQTHGIDGSEDVDADVGCEEGLAHDGMRKVCWIWGGD